MVEPLRHRQTRGAGTDMCYLKPPRHISTLPNSDGDTRNRDVGFTPMSGHRQPGRSGPKSANNPPHPTPPPPHHPTPPPPPPHTPHPTPPPTPPHPPPPPPPHPATPPPPPTPHPPPPT